MRRRTARKRLVETDRYFYWPAASVVAVMLIFPVVYTIYMSLHQWSGSALFGPEFVGLQNYVDLLFSDNRFYRSVWHTFYFSFAALLLEIVLGVSMALVFDRKFAGRGLLRTLFLFPVMATPAAVSLTWSLMFDPSLGVLNYFLEVFGLPPSLWVASPNLAIPSLVLVDVWKWTPLVMLIVLAGLASLPRDPYEAAVIDGASPLQILIYLTLPLLRPTIIAAAIIRTIDALKTFDIIYVITRGGPAGASETLNLYAFFEALSYSNIGYASAILVVFFFIVAGVTFFWIYVRKAGVV